ncbi:hypothetical protein J7L09_01650 [bacterium]|nr:hypothetical protein [bacterium]
MARSKSVWKNPELLDEYVKIYTLYFVLNWEIWEICKYLNISIWKARYALKWVAKNFLKLPAKELLNGAIYSVKTRLKSNMELYQKEKKKKNPSIRSIVELNRELREDSKLLFNLQQIYQEFYGKVDVVLSTKDVLRLITEAKEEESEEEKEEKLKKATRGVRTIKTGKVKPKSKNAIG